MKTKLKGILAFLMLLVVHLTSAQEKTITGTVTDHTGIPLPGVNILVEGTATGTQTDFDGIYTISAAPGQTLLFTYIGQKPTSVIVGGSSTIDVQMEEDAQALDEVVVTALGIKREKKSLGYAQQSIEGESVVLAKDTDISDGLAGKISGVQLVGSPSSTYESSNIRLRGNVGVLYVVDGIKINSPGDINMQDVEDISVLKGLAATALYGTEARNGAVIITTKTAKDGETKVTVDIASSLSSLYLLPKYQNEYGGGYSQTFAQVDGQNIPNFSADESWGPRLDGTLVRQWDSWIVGDPGYGELRPWVPTPHGIEDFYETGATSNITVGFLQGGEKYNIKTTVNHVGTTLINPNSDRKQTTISFKGSYNVTEKLKFNGVFNYQYRYTFNNPQDRGYAGNFNEWWQRQLDMTRLRNYKRNGQIVSWNMRAYDNPTPLYWDSPYFEVYENLNHETKNAIYGSLGLEYEILPELVATVDLRRTFDLYNFDDRNAWGGLATPRYLEKTTQNEFTEAYTQLSYNKKIGDFDLVASAGAQFNQRKYKLIEAQTVGGLQIPNYYSIDTSVDKPNYVRDSRHQKLNSTFATASVGYKNFLYLDGSYRIDWGSTAASDNNSVDTYGVSASFIFSEFINDGSFLSFGKIRAGFAQAPSFPDVYRLQSTYDIQNPYGSNVALSVPDILNNPGLIGGVREEIEIGTELSFLNNRLGLDFTYFDRTDKELPTELSLTGATGYESTYGNGSIIDTKGWEVALTATPFRNENFSWDMNFNISGYNKKVVKINDLVTYDEVETGRTASLAHTAGYDWGNIYGYDVVRNDDGVPVINSNGLRVYTNNYVKVANVQPDFNGGFINTFRYKNFDLGFSVDFQGGGNFFSVTRSLLAYSGLGDFTVGDNELGNPKRDPVLDSSGNEVNTVLAQNVGTNSGGVLVEGVSEETGEPISYYTSAYSYYKSMNRKVGEWIYDASYVKLRQLKIGYHIPRSILGNLPVDDVSISLYANNLWLIYSSIDGIDPSEIEAYSNSSSNDPDDIRWTEAAQDPNQRTFGLNLKFSF
ncbi:SusC/RagA family TonB-linked outer membrane protein [Flagellimonas aequoris]|uniref:SusC/RagA family TonB-linked outer membrane protein n=1 Tax=Flagellimonas aequoris TaxID=2306997 RepID=A0A418NC64_9FLAO|nr:SusC/RagA family TonB-linked outer membrane protein [Allomuricauda aequoris]RIV73902.1 SusC/RagA family TonB-linked outer membrane protein [Allomuricauda aequoris]TXK07589.1 SusC/RagA family TonB-linked outer membrane protein [Allomuricauda aequoris]